MGRKYKSYSEYVPGTSNTVCDRTGQIRKVSELVREWEGWYMIPEAFAPRQPQDFPIIPQVQQVFETARNESLPTDLTGNDEFDSGDIV